MYAFSTLTRNPYFRWYADQTGGAPAVALGLATYDPSLRSRHPRELAPARLFPGVGLAAIHTNLGEKDEDISFLFRSSPYGSVSHAHADQNAFIIEACGCGLAIDTGYYPWYSSPHHHEWTRATRSGNSVLVDGGGQARRRWWASGEIIAFHSDENYDYVEGEAGRAYGRKLKRFRRCVVHVRPGVFVMFDDLLAPGPVQFQWLLHAFERIAIDGNVLRIRRGVAAMDVHVLRPEKVRFSQTDKYDPEPEAGEWVNTWHLTVETHGRAAAARFLTVFLPHRKSAKNRLPKVKLLRGSGAIGTLLTFPDGSTQVVAFRTDPHTETVTCGALTSDARVFAERRDRGGHIVSALRIESGG